MSGRYGLRIGLRSGGGGGKTNGLSSLGPGVVGVAGAGLAAVVYPGSGVMGRDASHSGVAGVCCCAGAADLPFVASYHSLFRKRAALLSLCFLLISRGGP